MANLSKVIYINEEDYSTLLDGGTITKGGQTYSYDPNALYVIKNVSAPEYAETAGYATTAGQATRATQDGGGNVISETYAKKVIIGTLTWDNQNNLSCNKTYSQLASALLAGDIVLLKDSDDLLFYPTNHPYQEEGEAVGPLRFRYIGNGGYDESYRINSDNTIIYNYEDTFDESIYYQRTVLKLAIGQNNALTFKDQDNNIITATRAYYTLINGRNDQDVVIQYSGLEYHKLSYSDNSSITFVAVEPSTRFIYYLTFNCSTSNTVTLVAADYSEPLTENVDFGQGYGTSSNTALTATRTASIPGFTLKDGGIVSIKFTTSVINSATLNISSTGAKPIYYRGSAAPLGTINAGDTVTFIYDGTNYHIISIDTPMPKAATNDPLVDGAVAVGTSTKYAREDHRHPTDTTRQSKLVDSVTQQTGETVNFKTVNSQSLLGSGNINTNQIVYGVYSSGSFVESTLNQNNAWIGVGAVTPVKDKIYFDVITAISYVWNGTEYVPSSDLITVTVTGEYDNGTVTYSADKTFSEIYSAYQNGKYIICLCEDYILQLYYIDNIGNGAYFSVLIGDAYSYYTLHISSNNTVSLSTTTIPQLANNLTTTETGLALDATQGRTLKNMIAGQQMYVGSVAGKLYRNNVGGSGNFSISGNSGCIPNLTAGTFIVAIYAKSATQTYSYTFNFGSGNTYTLSTTNGELKDVRTITISSAATFSGSVSSGSVASGSFLYVVMYHYNTPVSTIGPAAVTNSYNDLNDKPTIPTVPSASSTAPLQVRGNTGSAGTSGAYARADHKHAICKSFESYSSLVADTDAQLGEIRYDNGDEKFYIYDSANESWVRLDNKDILPLIVDITSNNDTYTCNKTNAEIYEAWQAGRDVYVRRGGEYLYPLASEPGSTLACFIGPRYDELGVFDRIYIGTVNSTQQVTTTNIIMPLPGSSNPQMDGTASPGAANTTTYSKSDHVHPSDTSRVPTSRTINGHALSSDLYLTVFGNLGSNGFERDIVNNQGAWAGAEIVTPDPYTTYIDIIQNKLYRYNPVVGGGSYVEVGSSGTGSLTSGALTDLTDIL